MAEVLDELSLLDIADRITTTDYGKWLMAKVSKQSFND
jgi:hypothetical protein